MHWYTDVLKKYTVFTGRARRREYWMFVLISAIIGYALSLFDAAIGLSKDMNQSILSSLYGLAVLLPTIGVSIRRMHDANHSGWWTLVPIVNLVFALTPGTKGENRFGPDPKAAAAM